MLYLRRLLELVVVTFVASALPVLASEGLSKASLAGAATAGTVAVYGLLAKWVGDKDRPTTL